MLLWRLSGVQHAQTFDGGYGLLFDGRWNTVGHPVTYCATSPSLCVLEKLAHIEDPDLLPPLRMVRYDAPDDLGVETISIAGLADSWPRQERRTQQVGDGWHASLRTPLLCVPSAIVPIEGSPDTNFLINHRHPAVGRIRLVKNEPFSLDLRLL
jgi:RES domain-containing protein